MIDMNGSGMAVAIPAVDAWVYWVLFGMALLVCAAPLLVLRRDGPARTWRNVALSALLILPVMGALGYTISDNDLRVEGGRIVLRAAHFYEQNRALADFDLARARAGSYASIGEARLGVRRNGVGLPGYAAGRFSGPGKSVIFALLTDRSQVVYLPARTGPDLLFSVEEPERFLAALRADGH
ncbi:PH domain-containing protein [Massilia sp. GCM10023247]|uniref:PH domain-containing protein n=1 Tax=Massilia sp. GCM10023247 TaxID=3252643 RepID=UPI0036D31850